MPGNRAASLLQVTSNGLTAFIEAAGGKHLRFKRGYKNVINKAGALLPGSSPLHLRSRSSSYEWMPTARYECLQGIELNQAGTKCGLMIETSGHGAFRENYFLDDGAYITVKASWRLPASMGHGRAHRNVAEEKLLGKNLSSMAFIYQERKLGARRLTADSLPDTGGGRAGRQRTRLACHFLLSCQALIELMRLRLSDPKGHGKTLGDLIANLQEPVEEKEVRLSIPDK